MTQTFLIKYTLSYTTDVLIKANNREEAVNKLFLILAKSFYTTNINSGYNTITIKEIINLSELSIIE